MCIRSIHRLTKLGAVILTATAMCPSHALGDGSLRQPVVGLVHNRLKNSIQRIDGLLGGAVLSSALPVGTDVRVSAFDRSLRYAIVANSAGDVYLVTNPTAESPRTERLPGVVDGVGMLALNREGTVAALYSSNTNTLQLVTGLPGRPRALLTLSLEGAATAINAMAVLPGETGVVIASPDEKGHSRVLRVSIDSSITEIARAGFVRAIAVTADDSFTFVDSERNELIRIRGDAPGAEMVVLAGPGNGVDDPQGLCALDEGSVVLVNVGGSRAMVFNPEGREVKSVDLHFIPDRCEVTGADSLVLLNGAAPGPLYVLDPATGFKVMFVPPSLVEGSR